MKKAYKKELRANQHLSSTALQYEQIHPNKTTRHHEGEYSDLAIHATHQPLSDTHCKSEVLFLTALIAAANAGPACDILQQWGKPR